MQFVMDAFGHLKAIGHTPEAQPLLDKAGVVPDAKAWCALDKGFVGCSGQAATGTASRHCASLA